MKKISIIILFSIGCLTVIIGCAGRSKIEIQKKLIDMSDKELINHYEMIEMQLISIDRARERSLKQKQEIYNGTYPRDYSNHWGHLHIGDSWNELKKEKKLTIIEMKNRGITPQ
jgi:hypothetical protein